MSTLRFRVEKPLIRHSVGLAPGEVFEIKKASSRVHVDRWLSEGRISALDAPQPQTPPPTMKAPSNHAGAKAPQKKQPAPVKTKAGAFHPSATTATPAPSLQSVIANTDAILAAAAAKAGVTIAGFAKLPKEEKDAFLAEARGDKRIVATDQTGVRMFDPNTIRRSPFNRERFDEGKMEDLIASIKKDGVLQNGIIRPVRPPVGKICWEIIAGERRWTGAKAAKREFPAVVRDVGDTEALELQAMENLQREDLNPLDEGMKYKQLQDAYEIETGSKSKAIEKLEELTGKSKATIYEKMSLLELPAQVRDSIGAGDLPGSHAALLTRLSDPNNASRVAKLILDPKLDDGLMPFREAERLVKEEVAKEKEIVKWQKEREVFIANKWEVLTPDESSKIVGGHSADNFYVVYQQREQFIEAGTTCDLPGASYRQYGKLWKKPPTPTLARLACGSPVRIYRKTLADAVVKQGGKLSKGGSSSGSGLSDSQRDANRQHNRRKKEFALAVGQIVTHTETVLDSIAFWRAFATNMVKQWRSDPITRLAKRRGWQRQAGDVLKNIATMGVGELRGLCYEILLWGSAPYIGGSEWSERFKEACKTAGVQLGPWSERGGGKSAVPDDAGDADDHEEED